MTRFGACPCGAVRYWIDGPVRDVIVCHCSACRQAAGGPWPASAVRRHDLHVADEVALAWERAAVSDHDASRGNCRRCDAYVFWDAPGRETVSFAAETLTDGGEGLEVAAHIWVPEEEREALGVTGLPVMAGGLPESVVIKWRNGARTTG